MFVWFTLLYLLIFFNDFYDAKKKIQSQLAKAPNDCNSVSHCGNHALASAPPPVSLIARIVVYSCYKVAISHHNYLVLILIIDITTTAIEQSFNSIGIDFSLRRLKVIINSWCLLLHKTLPGLVRGPQIHMTFTCLIPPGQHHARARVPGETKSMGAARYHPRDATHFPRKCLSLFWGLFAEELMVNKPWKWSP